jgi:hypothetical protein
VTDALKSPTIAALIEKVRSWVKEFRTMLGAIVLKRHQILVGLPTNKLKMVKKFKTLKKL